MNKLVFFTLSFFLVATSCAEKSEDGLTYDQSKTNISVKWNGEPVNFTRITNGTIPGGAVTQIWLDDEDYKSKLSLRWGRDGFDGPYDYEKIPDVSFEYFNNGEKETYTASDDFKRSDYQLFTDEKHVYRIKGEIAVRPDNEIAQNKNPDGGTLLVDVQKEKRD